eukprot:3152764-Amphidinium_carterae.1
MDTLKVYELYCEMLQQLADNPETPFGNASMLKYREEIAPYVNEIFHYPKPSTSGDLVNYFAFCDVDSQGILDNVDWEHFVQYHRSATMLRIIVLDRLSRQTNRMAKTVWIGDLKGCPLAHLKNPDFSERFSADIGKFNENVSAEVMRRMYIINGPWWAVRLWKTFKRVIPEGIRRKFNVLDGGGFDDADFVHLVGGKAQLQQMLLSRKGLVSGNTELTSKSGEVSIGRKAFFEHSVDAKVGQQVSWSFKVSDSWNILGEPDVLFSVMLLRLDVDVDATPEKVAISEERYAASHGLVANSYTVQEDCIVTLRWSNAHSQVRSKTVSYSVEASSSEVAEGKKM